MPSGFRFELNIYRTLIFANMKRFTFQGSFGNISYLRRQGKFPVVFIHGFTASAWIWRSMTKYLDPDFDLVYVDLFGHGKSDTPELGGSVADISTLITLQAAAIRELITELDFSSYSVVGSSLGGWISMELAVNYMRPEKAVLIDSAGIMTMEDTKFANGLDDLLKEYSSRKKKAGRILSEMIGKASSADLKMDSSLLGRADFRISVIWGSDDHILDVKYGKELSRILLHSEFNVINGADHTPFRTHPAEVADVINRFLSVQ